MKSIIVVSVTAITVAFGAAGAAAQFRGVPSTPLSAGATPATRTNLPQQQTNDEYDRYQAWKAKRKAARMNAATPAERREQGAEQRD